MPCSTAPENSVKPEIIFIVPSPIIPPDIVFVLDKFNSPKFSIAVELPLKLIFDKFNSPALFNAKSLSLKVMFERFSSPPSFTLNAVSKFDIVPPEPITFNI